ncbi:MAG: hypothetical protein PSV17_02415 [Methylotenera sp.]|uniref:hypothetical protein n=1 Tax=Methylotenera sp. TaxID=2051956 RepID=UPI002489B316|nr:hypothetical protein [Methylotenera sp.]MDI1308273.1 hypothetical protein [Methylotenera sp.]
MLLTLASIAITCQVIYIQHGWINDDSVLYFEIARLFSLGEWKQGAALFNWPFYPALINFTHQLTTLGVQASAQLLNVIFFGITTYSFINLIKLAGGDKLTIISGTFLLLSSSYIVGDVLPMLLRDQGFWAMYLTSLVYFVKFYRTHKLSDALLWQVSAILAVLFRIEAITFLVCLPLILFTVHEFSLKQKITHYLIINLIPIFLIGLILSILILSPTTHLSDFGRLQEAVSIFPRIMNEISTNFIAKASIMGNEVLGDYLSDYGMLGVIISLASILIIKVLGIISWPVISIFALNRSNSNIDQSKYKIQKDTRHIFNWVLMLATLNAAVIIASVFILSSRYIIAFVFIVLIFASFHLSHLFEEITKSAVKNFNKKLALLLLLALIVYSGIDNLLPKRAGYNFEQEAVAYIKTQNVPNSKVFYVTPRSRYFAGAPYAGRGYKYWDYTKRAIEDGSIYQYSYLVININIDEEFPARKALLDEKLPQYNLVKEFYAYRKKKEIMIYLKKTN